MNARALLLALTLAGTAAAPAAALTSGCGGVPCGYIYPLILIQPDVPSGQVLDLPRGGGLEIPATLTFRFDMVNEGFTAPDPREPIVITFEFPRRPNWAAMAVEPARIEVPILPQYAEPDTSDPTNPQSQYVYTTDITLRLGIDGQPVVPDDVDYAKLLVFAKSTESGLYKSGYGIKELRVSPEGAIRASEAAGERTYTVTDAGEAILPGMERVLDGIAVEVTPPGAVRPWEVGAWEVQVKRQDGSPAPARVIASLTDAKGNVWHTTGHRDVMDGRVAFNLTLPAAGAFLLAVHAEPLPAAESPWVPQATAFSFTVPPGKAEAVRYGEKYEANHHETFTPPKGNVENPGFQYEKVVPFPVLEGASNARVLLRLDGPGNLRVDVVDATGATLATATADPVNPEKALPVGALPGTGMFHLLLSGAGTPLTRYGVDLRVNYDRAPVDVLAQTVDLLPGAHGPYAFQLKAARPEPWSPLPVEVAALKRGNATPGDARVALTFVDAAGEVVHATGPRNAEGGVASAVFTPPAPGRYTLLAAYTPAPTGHGIPGVVAALPLVAGPLDQATVTYPTLYEHVLEGEAPTAPNPVPASLLRFTVLPGAEKLTIANPDAVVLRLAGPGVDRVTEGPIEETGLEPGDYVLTVHAGSLAPATYTAQTSVEYAAPPTAANPALEAPAAPEATGLLSAPSVFSALVAVAIAAGIAFLLRRKD